MGKKVVRLKSIYAMNIKIENIELNNGTVVDLKWMRGASRYNNGGNRNGKHLRDKYPLRIIIGRLKDNFKNASEK